MKIVYHISDNDGRASAAIIYREFGVMQMMTKNDFIGLAYTKPFDIPEINPDVPETWYFVDIALNMETFAFIKAVLDAGHKVIHIDHHRNHEFIENKLDDEQKKLFEHENLTCMYDMRESATLLCFVYTCMDEKQRKNPNMVKYDFSEKRTHFAFGEISEDQAPEKEYYVPMGFRLINDHDVHHCEYDEELAFMHGIEALEDEDKHPMAKTWVELFRDNSRYLDKKINEGRKILADLEKEYIEIRKTAEKRIFELDGEKYDVICIKTSHHGSAVAGVLYEEHDAYCSYNQLDDGKWVYTFYSREHDKFLPCHKFAQKIDVNGGGHLHAAGCTTTKTLADISTDAE